MKLMWHSYLELDNCVMKLPLSRDGNRLGSDWVECLGTQNRNLNPTRTPIRVKIHSKTETREYLKPDWIPETRFCMAT